MIAAWVHTDSVTQVKVLKAGDLFNQLEALIQTLYLKTHAYVMASISKCSTKTNGINLQYSTETKTNCREG